MNFGISTQIFFPHRLTTGMLDALASSGVSTVEVFAGRHHFDYTDRQQLREIAAWFRGNSAASTLHAPVSAEARFSRHASPDLNLCATAKPQRIAAMEETKRALEAAEQIAFGSCILHLGLPGDTWSEYTLEYAMNAIEHLKAFAAPLGVRLLLENLPNAIATPLHLLEILRAGHFDSCGICLDVAHSALTEEGVFNSFELLRPRLAEVHLSDNDGRTDAHLWPASGSERPSAAASGTIDWSTVYGLAESLSPTIPLVFEINDLQTGSPADAAKMAREVMAHAARLLEARPSDREEVVRR